MTSYSSKISAPIQEDPPVDTTKIVSVVGGAARHIPWSILKSQVGGGNLVSEIVAATPVGGVATNDTFPVGTTVEAILDAILAAPLVLPTKTDNSLSFTGISGSIELGTQLTQTLSSLFTRGIIDSKDAHPDVYLTGLSTSKVYSGTGIDPVTGILNTPALLGNNTWTVTEGYGAGSGIYYDSRGNASTIFDAYRGVGNIVNTLTVVGMLPFFYGVSASALVAGTGVYTTLTKSLTEKSNKSVALNATDQYLYFAYPASYGNLTTILDGNGFNVTASFTKSTYDVTSTGLGSNYTQSYNVYRSNSVTTINQTFQFNF